MRALGLAIGIIPWVRHVGEQAATTGTLVFQVRFDSDGRVSMPGGGYGVSDSVHHLRAARRGVSQVGGASAGGQGGVGQGMGGNGASGGAL